MSIVESLKKLVDPVAARQTDAEHRSAREQPVREEEGDPPSSRCRVCGHTGPDPTFCPVCLAATMVPLKKEPQR
jgi:rubrerythrin